jgi:hypothetical protein
MKNVTSKPELSHPTIESNSHLFDDWFDPIEDMIRLWAAHSAQPSPATGRPRVGR